MYEFMVPEPSRFFKEAILQNGQNNTESCDNIVVLEKPIHPSNLSDNIKINNATELDEFNYLKLASIYNVEVDTYPEQYKTQGVSFTKSQTSGDGDNFQNKSEKENIDVPKGYIAKSANINFSCRTSNHFQVGISIGNKTKFYTVPSKIDNSTFNYNIGNHTEKIPVSAYFNRTWVGIININVKFERSLKLIKNWQNQTYKAILDAYNEQLKAYYDAKKEACNKQATSTTDKKEAIKFSNSFNRTIEKREIKRICIEMLTLPFDNPMGQDNYLPYDPDNNELPVVDKTKAFENHAAHVKFFEQAFDWEIMAYLFYPYYWAKNSDWKTLYKQASASDPIFQAFLQSGMARAVVPVRLGFEDAVNYYIETGDIWNGGDLVIDQENDLYLSIAAEMQNIEGQVEKQWETRVPTALTMVQKDTVGLDETGLPCCDFVLGDPNAPNFENTINAKQNNLGIVLNNDTTVTDGLAAAIEVIKAKLDLDRDSIDRLNTEIGKVEGNIVENIIIDSSKKFLELTTAKDVVVAKIEITAIKTALGL